MDFSDWFARWIARHPLKSPAEHTRADYTAEVMARVKAEAPRHAAGTPVHPWSLERIWPGLAFAAAAAVALLVLRPHFATSPAGQAAQTTPEPVAARQIVLAESQEDESWLEETVQLLDELGEDATGELTGTTSDDEEWLQELETLDEDELASSS